MKFCDIISAAATYGFTNPQVTPSTVYTGNMYRLELSRQHSGKKCVKMHVTSKGYPKSIRPAVSDLELDNDQYNAAHINIPKGGHATWKFRGFDDAYWKRLFMFVEVHQLLTQHGITTHLMPNAEGLKSMPPKLGWPALIYYKDEYELTIWQGTASKTRYQNHRNIHKQWPTTVKAETVVKEFRHFHQILTNRDHYDLKIASVLWVDKFGDKSRVTLQAKTRKVSASIGSNHAFEIVNNGGKLELYVRGLAEEYHEDLAGFLTTFLPLCHTGRSDTFTSSREEASSLSTPLNLV